MVGSERTANFLAILAVLAGFAVRAVWAFHVPFNDAPDESCHFPMAKFLRENGRPLTSVGRAKVAYCSAKGLRGKICDRC